MIFKGDEYDDTDGILEGWWSYFTDLFGNSDQGNFDTEKLEYGLFFVKYMLSAVHFSAVFLL
jgi:hypothetical protein